MNKTPQWWWDNYKFSSFHLGAGFFSPEEKYIERFGELMMNEIPLIDILASWLVNEKYFDKELKNAKRIVLEDMEPFFAPNP